HFIGMLAFELPIPVGYDATLTAVSLAFSVAASAYALKKASRSTLANFDLCVSAVIMGAGIACMHYIGMASMRMHPFIQWHYGLVALSILIAIVASGA